MSSRQPGDRTSRRAPERTTGTASVAQSLALSTFATTTAPGISGRGERTDTALPAVAKRQTYFAQLRQGQR